MLKVFTSALLLGMAVASGVATMPSLAEAADLPVLAPMRHAGRWCGPCGCLHVTFVRHRELKATYGIGFDPRSYDMTEPHYYYAAVRAFPRYWVTAGVQ